MSKCGWREELMTWWACKFLRWRVDGMRSWWGAELISWWVCKFVSWWVCEFWGVQVGEPAHSAVVVFWCVNKSVSQYVLLYVYKEECLSCVGPTKRGMYLTPNGGKSWHLPTRLRHNGGTTPCISQTITTTFNPSLLLQLHTDFVLPILLLKVWWSMLKGQGRQDAHKQTEDEQATTAST